MLLQPSAPAVPNILLKEKRSLCQNEAVVYKANREKAHCKYTEEAHAWLINRHLLGTAGCMTRLSLCSSVLMCPCSCAEHQPLPCRGSPIRPGGFQGTENGLCVADIGASATEAAHYPSSAGGKASYRRSSCPFCCFSMA